MGGDSAVASFVREWVRERFLLYRSERMVRSRSTEAQERVRRLCTAAELRLIAARELDDPGIIPATLPLYREAAVLLISALRSARDPSSDDAVMTPSEAFPWLESFRTSSDATPAPPDFDLARAVLADSDPLRLDRSEAEAAQLEQASLVRTLRWLERSVEPRTVSELKLTRVRRVLLVAIVVIGLLVTLALSACSPENLAEGKPAGASSRFPSTPEASGLTNGDIESTFGVHTNKEDRAWVSVDLRSTESIETIEVYNRADGYQLEALPLVLEVSENGVDWLELNTRSTPFTHSKPWVWNGSTRARHVRLRRTTPGHIALTEIKVFGG